MKVKTKNEKLKTTLSKGPALSLSNGFGLMEVLVASGILIIVISGTVALSNYSIRSTIISADRTIATQLAQQRIEQIRKSRDTMWIDNDHNTNWAGWKRDNIKVTTDPDIILNGVTYKRIVTGDDPVITGKDLLRVTSTVTWTEYNRQWSVELITLLSDWKGQY